MASLGNALVSKILGHSDAEKAFRPWWDNLEDFLMYGLVMLGLVVAPTAIINSTPLDCNYCAESDCDDYFRRANISHRDDKGNPNYSLWWVKKYCTMTAVDEFVLYFPYILLIMALAIVLIERVFIRIFKTGLKLDTFYSLISKTNAEELDGVGVGVTDDLENSKNAIEILYSFSNKSNYFCSYLIRTLFETILAVSLLTWLAMKGFPSIEREEFIYCDVHGYIYECAGHPQQFYMYVLFVVVGILCMYILCCVYNLLWLLFPQFGILSRVMRKYRFELRAKSPDPDSVSEKELLGDLYWIYYNNRDLKLLLDLLATSSGVSQSISLLTLFDYNLREKTIPNDIRITRMGENSLQVEIDEAEVIKLLFSKMNELCCIYTVELNPRTLNSFVQAIKFEKKQLYQDADTYELTRFNATRVTVFDNLDPTIDYTVKVSTLINGHPIASKVEKVEKLVEKVVQDSANG